MKENFESPISPDITSELNILPGEKFYTIFQRAVAIRRLRGVDVSFVFNTKIITVSDPQLKPQT